MTDIIFGSQNLEAKIT